MYDHAFIFGLICTSNERGMQIKKKIRERLNNDREKKKFFFMTIVMLRKADSCIYCSSFAELDIVIILAKPYNLVLFPWIFHVTR